MSPPLYDSREADGCGADDGGHRAWEEECGEETTGEDETEVAYGAGDEVQEAGGECGDGGEDGAQREDVEWMKASRPAALEPAAYRCEASPQVFDCLEDWRGLGGSLIVNG